MLRTRPPLVVPEGTLPFDLHVLGLPLAFVLSQDQTLHRNCFLIFDGFFELITCYFFPLTFVKDQKPWLCLLVSVCQLTLVVFRVQSSFFSPDLFFSEKFDKGLTFFPNCQIFFSSFLKKIFDIPRFPFTQYPEPFSPFFVQLAHLSQPSFSLFK